MPDPRKRPNDLLADNSHGESFEMPGLTIVGKVDEGTKHALKRIAGGVMFDTPSDQPSTARSSPRGRAKADERSPTSKVKPGMRRKRRG